VGSLNPIESLSGGLYYNPQDTQSLFTGNFEIHGNWRCKLLALWWVEPLLTCMPCSSMSVLIIILLVIVLWPVHYFIETLFREALSAVRSSNQLDASSNEIYMF